MSDNIFIKYIKIINERNSTIDLRGQVIIQNSCNKEKTVTIEYTTDSWDTDNRVNATWSRKLSPNQDLYDFEILSVKSSKLPLYLEFTVLCDIAGSILWISDGFNCLYDKDTPKEFFFNYTEDDDNSNYSMDEERKKLDELRRQLEDERKKLEEYNNEGRRKLKEERKQLEEERNQLEEVRKQLEEDRRQLEKQMMEINYHEDNTNSNPSQLSNSIFVKSIKVVNEYNGVIDLQGQVVVQTIGSDKSVIIEYTTDSWITNNSVNATWSHTLSSEQDSYYFKISVSKSSNLPLYLEFTALCNVAGTVLWTNSYEYLYDVGTPKELFFNDTFTESYIDNFFPTPNISKDEKKECSICTEDVDIKAFLNVTDLCNHDSNICRECIGEYIKHELEDKGNINISCPLDDCHEILRERDVKEFATEDVFTKYERLMINFVLSQIPTFQWCLNTNCGSGQDHYQGENVPIMTCNACGQKSCVVHGIPISDGCERCLKQQEERRKQEEQRQQEEEDRKRREKEESASESYVIKLKQCPKCFSRIEKNSGCDHMKCRRPGCGYEFCWVCMADFDQIRSQGNRVHKVNCKYYA